MISALVRYVYQSKVMNMYVNGQICLSFYFSMHCICRLTVIIALFSTAEENSKTGEKPIISLFPAAIITYLLSTLQLLLIFVFKCRFIPEFNAGNFIERFLNVILNTLVVIPYTSWDVPHEPPARAEEWWWNDETQSPQRPNRQRAQSLKASKLLETEKPNSSIGLDLSMITGPLMVGIGNLSEEIEKIWWKNPKRELTLAETLKELPPKFTSINASLVEKTLKYLIDNGFVNKTLFNPRRTKNEYFWLLTLQFLINLFSLIVELSNGGFVMRSGMHYYSWDIRLGTFAFGLVFLILYYKRYHLSRRLMDVHFCGYLWRFCPVFCCLREDTPLQAITVEDEMQRCLEDLTEIAVAVSPHKLSMGTQTQFSVESDKKVDKKYLETNLDEVDEKKSLPPGG
eukprot:TRINITY_DN7256_c0_g1_i1.p1 TRINITY_DN7256_c0_g1~~TRINITY_DN7256_c0_g1_i1.p1  ORF type:complete len:430 (+),score=115.61 TRINITY_DN7256_c0_g1_i1:95-1291(+)